MNKRTTYILAACLIVGCTLTNTHPLLGTTTISVDPDGDWATELYDQLEVILADLQIIILNAMISGNAPAATEGRRLEKIVKDLKEMLSERDPSQKTHTFPLNG